MVLKLKSFQTSSVPNGNLFPRCSLLLWEQIQYKSGILQAEVVLSSSFLLLAGLQRSEPRHTDDMELELFLNIFLILLFCFNASERYEFFYKVKMLLKIRSRVLVDNGGVAWAGIVA